MSETTSRDQFMRSDGNLAHPFGAMRAYRGAGHACTHPIPQLLALFVAQKKGINKSLT